MAFTVRLICTPMPMAQLYHHSLHDQYYTGDYNPDGTYKGDWGGNYLTDDQYIFTNKANNAKYVKNEYEMPYGTWISI